MNKEEFVSEVKSAIDDKDSKKVGELFNYARTNREFKELPTWQDDDGNTLLHALITSNDVNIMRGAFNNYEAGFAGSMSLKNNLGQTVNDCINMLDDEKLKEKISKNFEPSFKQGYLLQQFREYLDIQAATGDEYKPEDVDEIIYELIAGHCSGFSAIWAQCILDGNESTYIDLFKNIVSWDGTQDTLTPELAKEFEKAISITRTYHLKHLEPERKHWEDNKPEKSYRTELYNEAKKLTENQTAWENLWGEEEYVKDNKVGVIIEDFNSAPGMA